MSYIKVKVGGAELEIEYNYVPPQRGSRDRYGVPLEPDDPAEIEIVSAYTKDNIADLLGMASLDLIGEKILQDMEQEKVEHLWERRKLD